MVEKPIVEFAVQSSLRILDDLIAGSRQGVRMEPNLLAMTLTLVGETLRHVAPGGDPDREPRATALETLPDGVMLLLKQVGYAAFVEGIVSEGRNTDAMHRSEVATRAVMISARNAILAAGADVPLETAVATGTASARQGEVASTRVAEPVQSATEGLYRAPDFPEKQVRVERLLRDRFGRWGWPEMGAGPMAQFVDDIVDEVEPPFPLTDPGDGCTPMNRYQVRELLRLKDAEIERLEARVAALEEPPAWTRWGTLEANEFRELVRTELEGRLTNPTTVHARVVDSLSSQVRSFAARQATRAAG